jgi:hypothetical protein
MYVVICFVCVSIRNPSETTNVRKLPPTLSRQPSLTVNYADRGAQLEDDTFEHILQETAHQDTVMAFYYMDENNKVQFFEQNVCFFLLCVSLLLVSLIFTTVD